MATIVDIMHQKVNEGSSPGAIHSVQLSKYVSEELAASIFRNK